jgi:hypothetical protein
MIIINYDATQYVGLKKKHGLIPHKQCITLQTYFLYIQIILEYIFTGIFFSSHMRLSIAVKIKLFLHQQCYENVKSRYILKNLAINTIQHFVTHITLHKHVGMQLDPPLY